MLANWRIQLTILWCGQTLLMTMLTMSLPFWPLYVSTLGNFTEKVTQFWSMAIYAAPYIFCIFMSPLWGKLGDKYGYKNMVVRASFGLFITQGLIACFHNIFIIFFVRLLQGALAGFITAAQAWSINITPKNFRSSTIGKLQSATAIGAFTGPLLGSMLITYSGYPLLFTVSASLCGIVTLCFYFFLQESKCLDGVISKTQNIFSFNIKKIVIFLLLTIIIAQFGRTMIVPVFALFVTQKLGGNNLMIGSLYAITGLMVFVSSPLWGKWFDRKFKNDLDVLLALLGVLLGCALIQFLFAFTDDLITAYILRASWGIMLGALLPLILRLLMNRYGESSRGQLLGLGNSAINLGELLGILTGGYVELKLGFANNFLLTALSYFILAMMIAYMAMKQAMMIKKSEVIHEQI